MFFQRIAENFNIRKSWNVLEPPQFQENLQQKILFQRPKRKWLGKDAEKLFISNHLMIVSMRMTFHRSEYSVMVMESSRETEDDVEFPLCASKFSYEYMGEKRAMCNALSVLSGLTRIVRRVKLNYFCEHCVSNQLLNIIRGLKIIQFSYEYMSPETAEL